MDWHLGEQALKVVLGHDLDGAGADGVPDLVAVGRDAALDVKEGGRRLCRRRDHLCDGHHPRGPAHQHEVLGLGDGAQQRRSVLLLHDKLAPLGIAVLDLGQTPLELSRLLSSCFDRGVPLGAKPGRLGHDRGVLGELSPKAVIRNRQAVLLVDDASEPCHFVTA